MSEPVTEPLKVFLACRVESALSAEDKLELLIPMLGLLMMNVEIIEADGTTEIRVGPHNEDEDEVMEVLEG